MNNSPEQTAKDLLAEGFPIANYELIQSRRVERYEFWKDKGQPLILEDTRLLVEFGKQVLAIMKGLESIEYKGHKYWYEHRLAKDRQDICLGTYDPKSYCNGFYQYSTKDPGDGLAFVVVATDNPAINWYEND
jgi:hypothetical protein